MMEKNPDTTEPYNEEPLEEEHLPKGPASFYDTAPKKERVILVGVVRPPSQRKFETDEHLDELELLTDTAGAEVVEKVFQSRSSVSASTFVGKGKVEYIAERCKELDVQTVIFDDDLSPIQQRNLEKMIERKILDRTALILDIFALHARTNTAKTQVELAQAEYLLPRLSHMWTHLSKQYGGIGTKGPGETQIETDRRTLRERISHLKDQLDKIDRQRETQRKSRIGVVRVAVVGYTNAGKSTLLNMLTGADVLVEDKLFATLDSTVRSIELGRTTVLITDTVGFIRKLPTKLIASFKSTLDEVLEADILLHVVDATHPYLREQIDVVNDTLRDLGAGEKQTIMVFNKTDALESPSQINTLSERFPNSVFISALRGMNLGALLDAVAKIIEERSMVKTFIIRPPDFRIAAELHRHSIVTGEEYGDDFIRIVCEIKPDARNRFLKMYEGNMHEEN
jgi:GTPase